LLAAYVVPIPSSAVNVEEAASECPHQWPYLGKYDFKDCVPDDASIETFLLKDWHTMLEMCTDDDYNGIFHRFAPTLDKAANRARTCYWELPIMLDTGTASYEDAHKR
jgi:hypothetical protein